MKERPILFSTEMVRAVLDNRKTQTRRVVKKQDIVIDGRWTHIKSQCPYGQVGDRLWVRETFYVQPDIYKTDIPSPIHYKADGNTESLEDYIQKPSIFMPRWASRITLEITDIWAERVQDISFENCLAEGIISTDFWAGNEACKNFDKWFAEHGNKLPDDEYIDEGWIAITRSSYQALWDSINLKRGYGWDKNPYVWVITFKRVNSNDK